MTELNVLLSSQYHHLIVQQVAPFIITGDDVNSINILIEQYKQVNSIISDDVNSKKEKKKPIQFFERFTFMKSRWST